MKQFIERARSAVARNRELPLGALARKTASFFTERVNARFALRGCDAVGSGARVSGTPRIVNGGRIEIGDDLILMSRWNPVELVTGGEGQIRIGRQVAINFGTSIRAERQVTIGDEAMIGQYCIIGDCEFPERVAGAPAKAAAQGEPRPIRIGEGAWLAGRVTVLPGSSIGKGAVVTAGSVVDGEIPPGVLAAGIPARVVRRLEGNGAHGPERPALPVAAPVARPAVTHRGLIVADFTVEELARRLADSAEAPGVAVETAPFGQVTQTLLQRIGKDQADFAVVWTRPEVALPSFARLQECVAVTEEELFAEVDAFAKLVAAGTQELKAVFVPSWSLPPWQRGLGMLDARTGGLSWALNLANLRLSQALAPAQNAYVLNLQRWIDAAGRGAHSAKGWFLGKVPFSTPVFEEAAREIKAALRGLSGQARKLVVLDLDDTLWGGIVGDVGWEGLRLGGHDGVGEALVEFQRMLKALTRRGVVLAIASKNTESVALEAIDRHPAMVLRRQDFVGWRINWNDKAQNIADLTAELRLGLQSVVFIDDNPVERARVREALPEVLVPDWPEDKLLYPSALGALRCFDTAAVSKEDAERTRMYEQERARDSLRTQVTDLAAFLRSLEMRVRIEPLGASNLARTAQLLNKTNQMNLSTRRLTEQELLTWASQRGRALWTVSVSDKFGDAGLTGIVSVEQSGAAARVVDLVLSCRVMGRRIEQIMLHAAVSHARKQGLQRVEARFLPTRKNKPCHDFLLRDSQLAQPEPDLFVWDAAQPYPLPQDVQVEGVP